MKNWAWIFCVEIRLKIRCNTNNASLRWDRTWKTAHVKITVLDIISGLFKIWCFHGGDYAECRFLAYKNPVRISQETDYVSATQPSRLMLCKIWGFHGGDWMPSFVMILRVALARTDVSEDRCASVIKVARTGKLGTALAVTSKLHVCAKPRNPSCLRQTAKWFMFAPNRVMLHVCAK
jgi:hypothetical protein